MGCDFYTITALIIRQTGSDAELNQVVTTIELHREKKYFYDYHGDSDDSDYETLRSEYFHRQFKIEYTPILIYKNEDFTKTSFRDKYELIINNELLKYDIDIDECIITKEKYNEIR